MAHTRSAASLNSNTFSIGRNATMADAQFCAPQHASIVSTAVASSALFQALRVSFITPLPHAKVQSEILQADWLQPAFCIRRWSEYRQSVLLQTAAPPVPP